jgi:hypothetical protein
MQFIKIKQMFDGLKKLHMWINEQKIKIKKSLLKLKC